MKRILRYLFRRRFAKALDKADWRTATFPDHPEAGGLVDQMRATAHVVDANTKAVVMSLPETERHKDRLDPST